MLGEEVRIIGAEAGDGGVGRALGGHSIVSVGKSVKKFLQRTFMTYTYDFEKILLAAT